MHPLRILTLTRLASACLAGTLLALAGCAHLPLGGPQAAVLAVQPLARLDQRQLFAADPSGTHLALSDHGLLIVNTATGARTALETAPPAALGWSADGRLLAAAFPAGPDSRVALFDTSGTRLFETRVPGRAVGLFFTTGRELAIAATQLERFRFGALFRETLHHWSPGTAPVPRVLHETTLKPLTLRTYGADRLLGMMQPRLSPQRDELLYARLIDPPAFAPYRRITVRNLAGGAERELVSLGLESGQAAFDRAGEDLLFGDADGRLRQQGLWGDAEPRLLPLRGSAPLPSPDGRYLLVDGRLYRGSTEIATVPSDATTSFLADGRLLVGWQGWLYLVSEPPESRQDAPPADAAGDDRLRTLRAWRAAGLITAEEYAAARERIPR